VGRASFPRLPGFAAELGHQDWVERVTVDDNRIRVVATDMAAGRRLLLPLVVAHALELNRYEWVRPSLEEIFLDVSKTTGWQGDKVME
jgi:hypothetical protein